MAKILCIHGPNLNKLGERETYHYGKLSLKKLEMECRKIAKKEGHSIEFFQSNFEGEIIDALHNAVVKGFDCIILNAGGYSHTSIALRDAVEIVPLPVIEVHMSNIYAREEYRRKSLISEVATGTITGFREWSYYLAIYAVNMFHQNKHNNNNDEDEYENDDYDNDYDNDDDNNDDEFIPPF